ncbi:hypothetical protein MYCTH_2301214 [Thermothelomyces thermophilus ATCC 42464]|uniref:Uncharacterized protein n=1 Tax=Thermothelomyces thermophilus (strain ATCC 42464 / BCRC 31852 / DSM 1799) TaxID=573729 RepID=G2Q9B5_THET4|nr:uncharacterized protein MYCTH_2301214 [Thermothelomyces thermophilus ATCC 42464]AEO56374.1 hypothetical protein MYCTH_2301214 [Thermothelomyces thermophilus ATCC 42464]
MQQHTARGVPGSKVCDGYTGSVPASLPNLYRYGSPDLSAAQTPAAVLPCGAGPDYEFLQLHEAWGFDTPAIGSSEVQSNVWAEAGRQAAGRQEAGVSTYPVACVNSLPAEIAYSRRTGPDSNCGPAPFPGEQAQRGLDDRWWFHGEEASTQD